MSPMMLGLSLSLSAGGGGGGVVHPTPTQRQVVSNWNSVPNLAPSLMAAGGSYDTNQLRNGFQFGDADISNIRIEDFQYRLTPGTGVVVDSPAATAQFRRALEIGAVTTPASYDSGAIVSPNYKDLLAGGTIETDDIGTVVALANSSAFVRGTRKAKNVGTGVFEPTLDNINGTNMVAPSQQGFRTVGGAQVNGNGTLNSSGSGGGNSVMPGRITGIPSRPIGAIFGIGDSIWQYLNALNTATKGGWGKQGLNNMPGGKIFPWEWCAIDGNKMQLMTPAQAPRIWVGVNKFTCVAVECSTNDIAAGRSLVQLQADFTAISTLVKNTVGPYGLPVLMIGICCLNRGTFTGAMNTVKNDHNNWLLAGADTFADATFDGRPYQGDPAGYADNVHPTATDHDNIAAPWTSFMTAFMDPYYRPPGYVSFL